MTSFSPHFFLVTSFFPPRFFFSDVIFPTVFPYYSSSTIVQNVSLRITDSTTGSDRRGGRVCACPTGIWGVPALVFRPFFGIPVLFWKYVLRMPGFSAVLFSSTFFYRTFFSVIFPRTFLPVLFFSISRTFFLL